MGEGTKIEWADHTFNPWSGCTKVSEACRNCYAEAMAKRFPHLGGWGPGAPRKRTSPANWRKPLTWAKRARLATGIWYERNAPALAIPDLPPLSAPQRPRVFCASMGDWLDPEVPVEWLADLLALIAATPELDWLLLTKRPQLWRERLNAVSEFGNLPRSHVAVKGIGLARDWLRGHAPRNVWFGVSTESQEEMDSRWVHVRELPAHVVFFSAEPLLGPLVLPEEFLLWGERAWVIAGGESGPGARPSHPDWFRSLRDQCQEAGVPFFFKQWGAWCTSGSPRAPGDVVDGGGVALVRVGKKAAGRLLDGRIWDEIPRPGLVA